MRDIFLLQIEHKLVEMLFLQKFSSNIYLVLT